MRLLVNLMPEHDAFHIYIYTKSYFYRNLATGRLQYLTVKHSQYVKAHLSLQVSNLSRFCSSFICYCCSNMCFTHHSQVTKAIFSNLRTFPSLTFTSTQCPKVPQIVKMIQPMTVTRQCLLAKYFQIQCPSIPDFLTISTIPPVIFSQDLSTIHSKTTEVPQT